MRGRRDDEDDDRPLSSTGRGHTTRGNFSRLFTRVSFVRSPRARPERPGMAWARWMDEGPDPGENKDPGRDWTDLRRPDEKNAYRGLVGRVSEDALSASPDDRHGRGPTR
jgi:hypothetical protein